MVQVTTLQPVLCYIALGSNLGNRKRQLIRALELLRQTRSVSVLNVSSWQETHPVGLTDQPDFLNAVASIETTLKPLNLLNQLQWIEQRLGRVRTQRWGPRTIDLDILLYGQQHIRVPRLTVPHPEIGRRTFIQSALQELGARY
jgi:2-amino-4-hydroxy-6-hydroxymethyldihydropteridine diphosphokinase